MNLLRELFSYICGQQHCWVLGGVILPLCQRCTGLYAGAFCGLVLVLLFRPRPRASLYWIHGLFLLFMLPFGFHWIAHGGLMRTFTGGLFAFGLVYYLLLNPLTYWKLWGRASFRGVVTYFLMLGAVLAALLNAVYTGGVWKARILSGFAVSGFLVLFGCVAVNVVILPRTFRDLRRSSGSAV